tara:strand:- start:245 stop:886 length:642 start_codon:yes stop_codon:yes gene_type:complete
MTAKIKLNAASGGGSFSLQAPSSSSNNRVISLPDIADGTLLTSQSSLDSTKLSPAISAGISMADQWRLTTSFDSGDSDIASNWERVDSGGFGQLGTGMSESSGLFTFPSTGIYRIDFQAAAARAANDSIRFVNLYIKTTTNNGSSFSEASYAVSNIHNANNVYASGYLTHQFDVTDVSTHKVKFTVQSENTLSWIGNSNTTQTGVAFTRLGDT